MSTVLAPVPSPDAFELSERLGHLQRSLQAAETVSDLFARASLAACEFCGFDRALVLTVRDGRLLADGTTAAGDPECDALRRHALSSPMRLTPGTEESEILRRGHSSRRSRLPQRSALREVLGLSCYVFAPVVPESDTVALLLVDRAGPAVGEQDRSTVQLFAHLLGLALERTVLRARLHELCAELRHMTASANALSHEALTSPVSVPANFGWGQVFSSALGPSGPPPAAARQLLTTRELEIVELMVRGRSNRDIAGDLQLAPNTVKGTVARLLRKLGAANRAEAVGRYLAMQHGNIET
jgi:DNA-binding CsgD family transcriptional regulator